MRYRELGIETRREAPARARSQAEALLIRAGYLSGDGALTSLGQHLIRRLPQDPDELLRRLAETRLSAVRLESGGIAVALPSGGDTVLRCPACGYVDEAELATSRKTPFGIQPARPIQKVETPHSDTIESLAVFLGIDKERTAKAMMYTRPADGRFVFVILRGDMQVSPCKLERAAGELRPAREDEILKAGATPGYASPIGLRGALVVADDLIPESPNLVVGANEAGFHLLNANYGRDFNADMVEDVVLARAGEPCPKCGAPLELARETIVAGPRGIDGHKLLVACADSFQDGRGLCFPRPLAPFEVHLVQLASNEGDTRTSADSLYAELQSAGVAVLYDDRDERAGVKFNDADLIGCPLRLTVGEKNLKDGMIELKRRDQNETHMLRLAEATEQIAARLGDSHA